MQLATQTREALGRTFNVTPPASCWMVAVRSSVVVTYCLKPQGPEVLTIDDLYCFDEESEACEHIAANSWDTTKINHLL